MRITQEADYALRIVYTLAKARKKTDAKTLAAEINVPVRFCLKILQKLVKGGVAASYKGSRGGYMLAAEPSDINMKQIIELIDGPLVIHRCLDSEFCCSSAGEMKKTCAFHLIFDRINASIGEKFEKITLDLITDDKKSIHEILSML